MRAAALPSFAAIEERTETARLLAAALVFGGVIFNFVLCIVNAKIFSISPAIVMLAEMGLIGASLALMAKDATALTVILLGFMSYAAFLSAMRASVDLKAIRDVIIPIIFLFLGRRFGSASMGDRLVELCVWTVLIVGVCEYSFLTQYLKIVDIRSYYVARGTVDPASIDTTGTGLFASGIRPEGRTLLPFLGAHRVSSIFLEPVSMGNFGAIVFAWIALRNFSKPARLAIELIPAVAVFVMADARFGLMVSLTAFIIYPASRHVGRVILLLAPFFVIFALAVNGFLNADVIWDNGLKGRMILSGQMLSHLDFWEAMGFIPVTRFVSDSGYTYTLAKFGLVGCIGLWSLFTFAPTASEQAWRYRLFIGFYITALLIISDSVYSIKTAALAWFLAGCLEAPDPGDDLPTRDDLPTPDDLPKMEQRAQRI
ncbi:surface polysaccharide polymerase [Methylosinus sp. Sm6]|uniref:surface polysaccharide polymerase n=1 Tax=Methylosinus sp. Sm6 TaxID=2866948 RepID=UPI001C991AA4|nr:surface polysaccharide polymerase [Methylosinus sp. Sm6]MBY6241988.1 surface polysaccharide polymerase [Methylosinus sp. Sm6]